MESQTLDMAAVSVGASPAALAVSILKGARELIAKPGGRTRGTLARNAAGESLGGLGPGNPDACSFCAVGAIRRKVYETPLSRMNRTDAERVAFGALCRVIAGSEPSTTSRAIFEIEGFNDINARGVDDVLSQFDRAIELIEQGEVSA